MSAKTSQTVFNITIKEEERAGLNTLKLIKANIGGIFD